MDNRPEDIKEEKEKFRGILPKYVKKEEVKKQIVDILPKLPPKVKKEKAVKNEFDDEKMGVLEAARARLEADRVNDTGLLDIEGKILAETGEKIKLYFTEDDKINTVFTMINNL